MKISPVSFSSLNMQKSNTYKNTVKPEADYIPTTVRRNTLADMDFNLIADTIRCENLKKQMSLRLRALQNRLKNCMAQDTYS